MGKYKVRRDRILFIDLELTCWEGLPPPGQSSEIIEIGVVEVDVRALAVVRRASLLVRPVFSEVSAYCENLTGLTAERLRREGRHLSEVCANLRKEWGAGSKAWMSWGSDRQAVEADCLRKQVENPFSASFHDIGLQFSFLSGTPSGVGLGTALEMLGCQPAGRQHSGVDDAEAAAQAWIALASAFRGAFMPAAAPDVVMKPSSTS